MGLFLMYLYYYNFFFKLFLKGDGSLDGSEYQKVADITNYATKSELNYYLPIAVTEYT